MSKPLIYLAGPISGLKYGVAADWRDDVATQHEHSFNFASPLRAKEFLDTGEVLDHTNIVYDNVLSSPHGVMTRDSWDVHRCDCVFANLLGAERVSIGTVMELAWAWKAGTPSIIIMEPDNIHNHVMLRQASPFYTETVDEGIDMLYALFSK